MRQLIDALNGLKGKYVNIFTEHKLFGGQHIRMQFEPETEIGLGFRCRGQVIYINKNDISGWNVLRGEIVLRGSMMSIRIVEI